MLIKEYRIPLPLTVEEYRIAQLFMIAVSSLPRHPLEFASDFVFVRRKKVETRAKATDLEWKLS